MGGETYAEGCYVVYCDVCSRRCLYPKEARIREGNMECDMHWKFRTVQAISRHDAAQRPFIVQTNRHRRRNKSIPTYEYEEGLLLHLLTGQFGTGLPPRQYALVTNGIGPLANSALPTGVGWAGIYLYQLIVEAERPSGWIQAAKTKLAELAAWLVLHQSYSLSGSWDNGAFFGDAGTEDYTAEGTAVGGLASLYAYRIFGTQSYLDTAERAAHFLRALQCGDLLASDYATKTASGTDRWHSGMWTSTATQAVSFDHIYYPQDLGLGIWFLSELKTTAGDGTYGTNTTEPEFASSSTATLSTMISEARAFGASGVGGITFLAPSTIYEYYASAHSGGGGAGAFAYATGSKVSGINMAVALWGLYLYEGYSEQVAALYEALRAYTSSVTFETPDTYNDFQIAQGQTGDFDPKIALTTLLDVSTHKNASSRYELATAGLLSPIQSAKDPGSLKTAKEAITTDRQRGGADVERPWDSLVFRGRCGLTYQTAFTETLFGSTTGHYIDVAKAAQIGLMFRQAPKANDMVGP